MVQSRPAAAPVQYVPDRSPADGGRQVTVPLREQATLDSIRGRLDGRLSLSINRRRLAVAPGGSLAGVAAEELPAALAALSAPCRLVFGPLEPSGCSDDHIAAVNLSRRLDGREPPDPQAVRDAVEAAAANKAGAADVVLEHYLGGPCHPEDIACCVVLGGDGCGWTVVEELQEVRSRPSPPSPHPPSPKIPTITAPIRLERQTHEPAFASGIRHQRGRCNLSDAHVATCVA